MRELQEGDNVGEYILERKIGQGTFGEVWKAHHAVLNEIAAVKVATDPEYVKNLRTEGVIQHEIDNPHIVRTLGLDPWHDPPYLVIEYVEGESLGDLLRDGMPLAVETAVNYARQMLEGVAAAHAAGAIYRDLKPENVLVDRTGVVKITDFRLGPVQETTVSSIYQSGSLQSQTGASIVGTVAYMAPEQQSGGPVDQRADLYAFGVVLFEMLTGTRPVGTDSPSDLSPHVPSFLNTVFRRCCCHLSHRFKTSAEVLDALGHPIPVALTEQRETSGKRTSERGHRKAASRQGESTPRVRGVAKEAQRHQCSRPGVKETGPEVVLKPPGFDSVSPKKGKNEDSDLSNIERLLARGVTDLATQKLEDLLAKDETNTRARFLLAQCYAREAAGTSGVQVQGSGIFSMIVRIVGFAISISDRLKLERAKSMVEKCIEEEPDDSDYYKELAGIYFGLGEYRKALSVAKSLYQSTTDNPGRANLNIFMANSFRAAGQEQAFLQRLELAARYDPANPYLKAMQEYMKAKDGQADLVRGGVGAGIGAVAGGLFGHPGLGAVAGAKISQGFKNQDEPELVDDDPEIRRLQQERLQKKKEEADKNALNRGIACVVFVLLAVALIVYLLVRSAQ